MPYLLYLRELRPSKHGSVCVRVELFCRRIARNRFREKGAELNVGRKSGTYKDDKSDKGESKIEGSSGKKHDLC